MNQEIKQKWVEALRSGEYKQGDKQLRNGDKFCCLGVLCDLHSKETGRDWSNKKYPFSTDFSYCDSEAWTPRIVIDWADLGSSSGDIVTYDGFRRDLPFLNDTVKLSFTQIADIIEAQL